MATRIIGDSSEDNDESEADDLDSEEDGDVRKVSKSKTSGVVDDGSDADKVSYFHYLACISSLMTFTFHTGYT